ncbi:hypothetical protein L6164_036820 [Bauhinia variegata]|uniref:Uncharacterized protein n=1 Tax=Bauhinia variegata TaxID=167791 RepID=A0ACB9KIE7_BAUVA|nr:hypothetical protein L6164_036820 [Bauhinia variegata]
MVVTVDMKHLAAICFALWARAFPVMSRTLNEDSVAATHEQWITKFGRSYANEAEKAKRFKIFMENLLYIENFNNAGNQSYKMGSNKFSDLTNTGKCDRNKAAKHAAQITGYVVVKGEDQLLQAVAKQPVAIRVAAGDYFHQYEDGIFSGPCESELNHEVTVVGYGTSEDGTKYWLMKNSWGEDWGEKGYIRMKMNVGDEGLCGIATHASYPTINA